MEKMLPVLAIAGVAGLLVLAIVFVVRQKQKIRAAYEGFAKKYGLSFSPGAWPVAEGKIDERYTLVRSMYVRKQQLAHFVVQLAVRGPVPPELVAYGRARFDSKGLATGDEELDRALHIEAPDAAALKAWLTAERRAALLELAAAKCVLVGANPKVPNSPVVTFEQPGFKPRLEWIDEQYGRILAFARRFD